MTSSKKTALEIIIALVQHEIADIHLEEIRASRSAMPHAAHWDAKAQRIDQIDGLRDLVSVLKRIEQDPGRVMRLMDFADMLEFMLFHARDELQQEVSATEILTLLAILYSKGPTPEKSLVAVRELCHRSPKLFGFIEQWSRRASAWKEWRETT